jgi:hypothetical protein
VLLDKIDDVVFLGDGCGLAVRVVVDGQAEAVVDRSEVFDSKAAADAGLDVVESIQVVGNRT